MLDYRMDTFLTLCETMNYTKTAEMLFITQPAVTGHIHYLESFYGVKLFSYEGKRLALTPEGSMLLRYAQAVRADNRDLKEHLLSVHYQKQTLRFGATKTIGDFCMRPILQDYMALYPDISVHVTVDNTHLLLQLLDQGSIDFALVEGFFESSQYDSIQVADVSFLGVCSAQHPLAGQKVNFQSLSSHCLILREPGSGTRDITEGLLEAHNLRVGDFLKTIETGSFILIRDLVNAGAGITFVYQNVVAPDLSAGRLIAIDAPGARVQRAFHLVALKGRIYHDQISAFYQLLQNKNYFHM